MFTILANCFENFSIYKLPFTNRPFECYCIFETMQNIYNQDLKEIPVCIGEHIAEKNVGIGDVGVFNLESDSFTTLIEHKARSIGQINSRLTMEGFERTYPIVDKVYVYNSFIEEKQVYNKIHLKNYRTFDDTNINTNEVKKIIKYDNYLRKEINFHK